MSYTMNVLTEADYANGIPQQWDPMLRFDAKARSLTQKFEGQENTKSFVIRKDDLSKMHGDTMHFQTLGRLIGKGRASGEQLEGKEEKVALGRFSLTVTECRHAVSYKSNLKITSLYAPGEWARPQLADWYATRMDNDLYQQLIVTDIQKIIYAGDATSEDTLQDDSGDIYTLSVASLEKANSSLESIGAEPLEVIMKNGEPFKIYGAIVSNMDKWHLMRDPAFKKANELANLRGEDNPVFVRAFGKIGGMMLYTAANLRGFGNPIRPEAKVYGAHSNSVTTIVVGSDTSGIIDYTEFFPDSGTLAIKNDSGAIEYVPYSAKTTYSFTGCSRGQTYGGVTSVASAYTGGDNNEEFVCLGHNMSRVICFGAQGVMRGFAQQIHNIEDKRDYGKEVGIGIEFIRGHKAIQNSTGRNRGYMIMKCNSRPFDAVAA